MNENNVPEESEYSSGGFGKTPSGKRRPLTRAECVQAERSAMIRRESVAQAADRMRGLRPPARRPYAWSETRPQARLTTRARLPCSAQAAMGRG